MRREDRLQLVLKSGFSTAKILTEHAGRGVGLDVVNSVVASLGGSLHIDSEPGQFAQITLILPLSVI